LGYKIHYKFINSNIANINYSLLSTNVSIEQKIDFPEFAEAEIEVYVKRDDLIHPFISGNKWRKLKYNYKNFLESGYKGVVTFGGAFSNHILATAAFAAHAGIPCIGIIRGEAPQGVNHVLILARLWGMQLFHVSREAYNRKGDLGAEWRNKGYFIIPEGGENEAGVQGCEEIVTELNQKYDHIICASGTGCTIAGILRGVLKRNWDTRCHSIPVLKEGLFIKERVMHYQSNIDQLLIHPQFHFGGYAKTDKILFEFLNNFASKTGILTDPVYTAKMFYALFELVNSGQFLPGQKVLAVHTGGLTGLLSEKMLMDVQNSIFKK